MSNVSGTITLSGTITEKSATGTVLQLGLSAALAIANKFTNGTGAGQADLVYAQPMSLAATTQTIDLTNLTDVINGSIIVNNFARVRLIAVVVDDTTAGHKLLVSRGASNGWTILPASTSAQAVEPNNGIFLLTDMQSTGSGVGYVVGSSSKTILLDSGANTVTFSLMIVGCSALS